MKKINIDILKSPNKFIWGFLYKHLNYDSWVFRSGIIAEKQWLTAKEIGSYKNDSKSNRQFEMEVVDLLVSECEYKGLHLGGGRKPDGIIYTENLKENYGTIIDTKAYSSGYSLPISQADEMRRYIEENKKRDTKINPNKWWDNFPKALSKFNFLFVSSQFNGQFEEKLHNISNTTGINGAAMNVVNLLLFAENIKSEFIGLEQAYQLMIKNSEIKLIDQ